MKTYKQLADEWGVTKDAVRYRAAKLSAECRVITQGITYVTDEGIDILRNFLYVESRDEHMESHGDTSRLLIETLQKQLEVKDRQIADLSNQNALLTNSLAASQALHAGTMKHLADNEARPGLFSRLFPKSKKMSQGESE